MKLYELTQNYQNLLELLDNEEVDKEMIKQALDEVMDNIKSKIHSICTIVNDQKGDIDMIDAEIKRLQALKKNKQSNMDFLKGYLSDMLQANNINKMDTGLFRVGFRTSVALVVNDEEAIPEKYLNVQTKVTPDKRLITEKIKNGEQVDGCSLEVRQNIQIK